LLIEVGEAGGVAELPLVGQPGVEIAHGPGGQIHQQLRQVELRIDVVPAAGGSQANEEGGGAVLGALLGGIIGHGKGAAIGSIAGAGAGTAV